MINQKFSSTWDALEADPIKAKNLRLRANVMQALEAYVKSKGLTQQEAAKVLGTSQPKISSLLNGKIDEFRLDKLIDYALKAGLHIDLKIAA